jgi:hypothetical protein
MEYTEFKKMMDEIGISDTIGAYPAYKVDTKKTNSTYFKINTGKDTFYPELPELIVGNEIFIKCVNLMLSEVNNINVKDIIGIEVD